MPIFELRNVSFRYPDGVSGLCGVSLAVHQGERLGVVGPNGSGKSTLLKVLAGLYFPQEGEVLFSGEPLSESRLREKNFRENFRRRVAVLFQNPDSQILFTTVWREILFGPEQLKVDSQKAQEKAQALLQFFHIEHLKERHPFRLSGGEKKKVILASLLILEPETLLLDEPTDNLDPRSAAELTSYLAKLPQPKTMLLATHDLKLVSRVCTRVYLLSEEKRIATEGRPRQILRNRDLLYELNLVGKEDGIP